MVGQQAAFLIQYPAGFPPQLFQLKANLVSSRSHRAGQLPHPPRKDQRHGEECYREQEREDVGHPRTVAGL